jgi:hypothetical protein
MVCLHFLLTICFLSSSIREPPSCRSRRHRRSSRPYAHAHTHPATPDSTLHFLRRILSASQTARRGPTADTRCALADDLSRLLPPTAQEPMPLAAEVAVPAQAQDNAAEAGGRERKSVNHVEPKLNTKMKRPDPPPGAVTTSMRKRNSASAACKSSDREEAEVDVDIETDAGPRSSSKYSRPAPSLGGRSKAAATSRRGEANGDGGEEVEPTMIPLPVLCPPSSHGASSSGSANSLADDHHHDYHHHQHHQHHHVLDDDDEPSPPRPSHPNETSNTRLKRKKSRPM